MLGKIALRNIRRSVRDYAVYFVTILFGVAVFYAFNSIGDQQVLFDLKSEAEARMFDMAHDFLGMFSIVIAFVLGFLVIYANRFLIKRRKREFATYLILGMGSLRMSLIVLMETAVVGLLSLAIGLLAGFALSQALSFVTAALFDVPMSRYEFVFSSSAFGATLACFSIIYVVVALFNLLSVNKLKLIDLLSAGVRNEKAPVRNPWVCLVGFIASVGMLAVAYWHLHENGLLMLNDSHFAWATGLMLAGSLLFFWSLSGFVVAALTRAPGLYFRGLRPFTVRQIASKINTAFVSLWAVCVMLFFSITVFSTGMGMVDVFTKDIAAAAPYHATIRADVYYEDSRTPLPETNSARRDALAADWPELYAEEEAWEYNALAKLEASVPGWESLVRQAAELDYYKVALSTYESVYEASGAEGVTPEDTGEKWSNLLVVGLSQFNATRALLGQDPVTLADDECIINNTADATKNIAKGFASGRQTVSVAGESLAVVPRVCETQSCTTAMMSSSLEIVVPDHVINALRGEGAIPYYSYVNLMLWDPSEENSAALQEGITAMYQADVARGVYPDYWVHQIESAISAGQMPITIWPVTMLTEQTEMITQAGGIRMLVTYLALYVGFVLLIATAAVLAVQQLSEVTDSLPRYRLLAHLGCEDRSIRRSLLTQTLVYFLAPLALAACHAAYALAIMNGGLFKALGVSVAAPVSMAAVLIVVVYGGYLAVTYFVCRAMVRSQ